MVKTLLKSMHTERRAVRSPADRTALLISAGLSPFCTVPCFILLVVIRYTSTLAEVARFWLVASVFVVGIPAVNILTRIRNGEASDIHLANRQQRITPFLLGFTSALIGSLILLWAGAPRPVVVLAVAYLVASLITIAITLFWKVSIHTALNAGCLTAALLLFRGAASPFIVLLAPLVWARVRRGRHTMAQAILGIPLVAVIAFGVFYLFHRVGYLPSIYPVVGP
jgi:hypothetical protein